jgi:hypothetical protein
MLLGIDEARGLQPIPFVAFRAACFFPELLRLGANAIIPALH